MNKPKKPILILPPIRSALDSIDEVNEVLLKKKAEAKVKAENEAFDYFVTTGEIVPVEEDLYNNLIYHGHIPGLGKTASIKDDCWFRSLLRSKPKKGKTK